jgi:subtilisin family serine protease
VLSNSWAGSGFSQALFDEINRANQSGILFVAAAGNTASDNDSAPTYPSSYAVPNVVAVAAINNQDALASFSNFGATSVRLGAPGVQVLSAVPGAALQVFERHLDGDSARVGRGCAAPLALLYARSARGLS